MIFLQALRTLPENRGKDGWGASSGKIPYAVQVNWAFWEDWISGSLHFCKFAGTKLSIFGNRSGFFQLELDFA
jgi:hypothetical protein